MHSSPTGDVDIEAWGFVGIPDRVRGFRNMCLWVNYLVVVWWGRGLNCSGEGPVKLNHRWSKIYFKVRMLEEEKGSQKPTHANIGT